MRALGIALIVIGLFTLALPYVTFTKKEKVIDLGPIQATREKQESFPVSPIIGGLIFVAGVGIVISGAMGRKA